MYCLIGFVLNKITLNKKGRNVDLTTFLPFFLLVPNEITTYETAISRQH